MTDSSSRHIDFNHWLLRLIAYVIDTLIIGIIVGIIMSFIIAAAYFIGAHGYFWLGAPFYVLTYPLTIGIVEVIYFIVLEVFIGATIGKKILGFEVQMKNDQKVTAYSSFIRNISKIYWLLLVIDWLLAVLIPGPDGHQKYSDRFARTIVIQVRQPFTSPPPSPQPQPPSNLQTSLKAKL